MFRQIDTAVNALKIFLKMTHCIGDRCTIGTFNDSLSWIQELKSEETGLVDCLNHVGTCGGTRLYDSLCDAVDYLHGHASGSRPWFIFALTYNNDDNSIRSAEECRKYIFTKFANRINKSYIFVISVGKNVDTTELDGIGISGCLYHVHAKSSIQLENDLLWKIGLGEIVANRTSAMDYVALINNSASMRILKPLKQHSFSGAPLSTGARAKEGTRSASSETTTQVLMESQDSVHDGPEGAKVRTEREPELSEVESKPPPCRRGSGFVPEGHKPAPLTPPAPSSSRVTIRMREFLNRNLHPSDRQIFREFALKNYPNIPNSWEEEDIEFLVLVESAARSIVGLLVMLPLLSHPVGGAPGKSPVGLYPRSHAKGEAQGKSHEGRVHIRLMVVSKEYRKHGLGTKMLTYVASKYRNRTVTLNVTFDRLDLLNFYYDKGYVSFEEFSTKHQVIVFSLVHLKLLATMPFPG
jgi:GNAT superfamily N-acetyltransferase